MKHTTPLSLGMCRAAAAVAFIALLLACALFSMTPQTAHAAPGDIVRGTVTSELPLYAAFGADPGEAVGSLSIGATFQALELEGGWYGASFGDGDRYFNDASCFALYTAPNADVYRGAVVGGALDVLVAPAPAAAACGSFANGATIQFCQFDANYYMARLSSGAICYIPVSRVRLYGPTEAGTLVRWASAAGTAVYEAPDAASNVLLTFEAGRQLWFADFDAEWLMASMTVDGAARTVFVPKSQVLLEPPAPGSEDGDAQEPKPPAEGEGGNTQEPEPPAKSEDGDAQDPELPAEGEGGDAQEPEPPVEGGDASDPSDPDDGVQPVATEWVIGTVSRVSGMSEPTWDSVELAGFRKGAVFTALPLDNGWYRISYEGQTMYLAPEEVALIPQSSRYISEQPYGVTLADALTYQDSGSWIVSRGGAWTAAEPEDIMLYMDPSNFAPGTAGFFQFLLLDQPLGVSVETLNAQLAGKGTLEGQGLAFHDAAYAYGINEAYLISHALHETGNGTSNLAKGVWYDPETQTASYEEQEGATLVYNMYGIGAVDSNPLNGGAKYAYEHEWFTPYDAVYGGAAFIGRTYLYSDAQTGYSYKSTLSGQNTLYKMLWHPEWVALYQEKPWHQYATDVAWANAQTYYYTQLLADYDYYTLTFEVPTYAG